MIYIFSNLALHSSNVGQSGISIFGAVLASIAVVCSWTRNKSLFWAFIAGILSIFYIIYWNMTRKEDELRK